VDGSGQSDLSRISFNPGFLALLLSLIMRHIRTGRTWHWTRGGVRGCKAVGVGGVGQVGQATDRLGTARLQLEKKICIVHRSFLGMSAYTVRELMFRLSSNRIF